MKNSRRKTTNCPNKQMSSAEVIHPLAHQSVHSLKCYDWILNNPLDKGNILWKYNDPCKRGNSFKMRNF